MIALLNNSATSKTLLVAVLIKNAPGENPGA